MLTTDDKNRLFEEIMSVVRERLETMLDEAYNWRAKLRTLQALTPEAVTFAEKKVKSTVDRGLADKMTYPRMLTQTRYMQNMAEMTIVVMADEREDLDYDEYDIYAYTMEYEPSVYKNSEGWAANVVRIHNKRFDTAFRVSAHYLNRFAERNQLRKRPFSESDHTEAQKMMLKVISDIQSAYIMYGNHIQAEKYDVKQSNIGAGGDNIVAYTRRGMALGFINAERTYIVLNTFVDKQHLYPGQRDERALYYRGRFIKKMFNKT